MSSYLTGMNVLVTGASDGIGAELAAKLAQNGAESLILAGRNRSRLEETALRCKIPCRLVIADLATSEGVDQLLSEVSGEDIDGLVNNAGVGLGGRFEDLPLVDQDQMIFLNCQALVRLSHSLLQPMKVRQKGFILFVGSLIGYAGGPGMAAYSGTKGFVNRFAESLGWEMHDQPIRILLLAPGVTQTSFFKAAGISEDHIRAGQMSPEEVAGEAIRGLLSDRGVVVAGWRNRMLLFLVRFAPRWMVGLVSRKIFSQILTPGTDTEGKKA